MGSSVSHDDDDDEKVKHDTLLKKDEFKHGEDAKMNHVAPLHDDDDEKVELDTKSFIFKNDIKDNITRMDHDREMIIGFWSEGKMSHASLFVCYFSEVPGHGLVGRVFCIELFVTKDGKQTKLSLKGPVYNTRDYVCKEFYIIHANMNEIIDIAKKTINEHGSYKYWTNNCRTFASNCLQKIKQKCGGLSVSVTAKKMNAYIHEYVTDQNSKLVTAENLISIASAVGVLIAVGGAVCTGGVVGAGQNKVIPACAGKSMSFMEVLKKYPLA